MVWCHMCKKSFSIKTKGALEILRHHRTEKHLRRDQRWRYDHLKSTDPVCGKTQHRVRGRNGKILSKMERAKELSKFIHVELVDVGERLSFYEDFVKGITTAAVIPESRTRRQLCLVGYFIHANGDLSILRNLWSRVGSYTNHQAALCEFDCGEERFSVNIVSYSVSLRISLALAIPFCPFRQFFNISTAPWTTSQNRSQLNSASALNMRIKMSLSLNVCEVLERIRAISGLHLQTFSSIDRYSWRVMVLVPTSRVHPV